MRRALWAIIGVLLANLAIVVACGRVMEGATLMPAAGGAIETMALQFHRPGHEVFLPVFGQILASLDPGTAVEVVVADSTDRELFETARAGWFPEGGGPDVRYAFTDRPITSWIRDRFAVVEVGGDVKLVAPDAPKTGSEARAHDWTVPWTLAESLGLDVIRLPIAFDGGDLIADDERIYVAPALFGRNPDRDPEEVVAILEHHLGLPVLRLGAEEPVPNHHIGMFVTPLGDGRVAVLDPDLAIAALGDADLPVPADLSEARLDRFRQVRRELTAAGLDVIGIPGLPTTERFVWYSYDNAVLEHRADGLHVVLPTYGVPTLDGAAIAAWEGAGAKVHQVDVSEVFVLGGSVRCLTAPIRRGAQ